MNSRFLDQTFAVLRKEWQSESQSPIGLVTSGLIGLLMVITFGFAAQNQGPTPTLQAGMLVAALLFTAVLSLPRVFIAEDEQGTFQFLRLHVDPAAIFTGKFLFCLGQMILAATVLTGLFAMLMESKVASWPMLLGAVGLQCTSFAATSALCGVMVIGAANRWTLVAVLSGSLLLPQTALGVTVIRVVLGQADIAGKVPASMFALLVFGAASVAIGPRIAEGMLQLSGKTDQN